MDDPRPFTEAQNQKSMYIEVIRAKVLIIVLAVSMQTHAGWMGSIIDSIPGKPAEGVRDYMEIVGISPDSGRNSDISKYNADLVAKNPCIRNLATQFYFAIEADGLPEQFSMKNLKKPLPENVALSETVKTIGLKPGWLWEKAMEITKGNKTLALQIIGLCGHDDMNQIDGYVFELAEQQRRDLINSASKIPADVRKILTRKAADDIFKGFVIPPSEDQKQKIFQETEKSINDGLLFQEGVSCPNHRSRMFYPQSLGSEADISQDLKDRIIAVQAPTKGGDYLPAKSYHVTGSAALSCVMLRKGVPETVAKTIVTKAVNAYRATRLCEKLRFNPKTLADDVPPKAVLDIAQDMKKNKASCKKYVDKKSEDICTFVTNSLGIEFILDPEVSQEVLLYNLTRGLAKADAASMFLNSWSSLLANKCDGVQITSALQKYFKKNGTSGSGSPCSKALKKERCDNARKLMDEWSIDFEWSEAAQVAGFNFAKNNCDRIDSVQALETQACELANSKSSQRDAEKNAGSR